MGIASTTLPEYTIYLDRQYITSSQVKSSDMVYIVGLGLRYNLSPRLALSFFASYMASDHEFENIKVTQDGSGELNDQNADYKIETLHSGIGLAYRFF